MKEHRALEYLHLANHLFENGDNEGAIGACQNAIYHDKNFTDAFLLMSKAFINRGYLDAAVAKLQKALSLDPNNSRAKSLLAEAVAARAKRNRDFVNTERIDEYTVLKYLGSGWEGAVYIARDIKGSKFVIKIYYPHYVQEINHDGLIRILRRPVESSRNHLINLSKNLRQNLQRDCDILYPIDILEIDGEIKGIFYKYEKLIKIKKRHLIYPDVVLGILSAFFRTQSYLIKNLRLCLSDASINQFMITRTGSFRFIDYGVSIVPIDDFRCLEEHWEIITLISFLYQLFNPEKLQSFDGSNFEVVLDKFDGLLPFSKQYYFLNEILEVIGSKKYSYFLDYRFYLRLAAKLPRRLGIFTLGKISILDFVNDFS